MKVPFIAFLCDDQKYLFYYTPGKEDVLLCTMMGYAADPQHAFGWDTVRSAMRQLNLDDAPSADDLLSCDELSALLEANFS